MPPYSSSTGLPSSDARNRSVVRRSARSSSGRSRSSQKRNTSESTAVWVSFRSSTLASSTGPNESTVARTGAPPSPVSDSSSTGCERGSTVSRGTPRVRRRSDQPASIGCARPERSPLTSATNTGTPGVRELPGDHLQRLGLPRAGGAGDEPVPVHGRERQPDPDVGEHLAVEHRRSEDHSRRVVRVAGAQVGLEPLVHGVTIARGRARARVSTLGRSIRAMPAKRKPAPSKPKTTKPTKSPKMPTAGPTTVRAFRRARRDLRGARRDALQDVRDAGAQGGRQGVRRDVRRRDDVQARARRSRERADR